MGQQIIKQPDGKYCIFSTEFNDVTYYDMTKEEIIEVWSQEAISDIKKKVNDIIDKLNKGEKPYYQFTMTYSRMIDLISSIHGKASANEIRKEIENI